MNFKRVLGLLAIGVGVALLIFVNYENGNLTDAKNKISSAKKNLSTGNSLFSLNPIAKEIGKEIDSAAQKKLGEADAEVKFYDTLFMWLQVGGVGLIVVGIGATLFYRKNRRP